MFDPKQVFSSPSINYCGYGEVYCKPRVFNGERFIVAFQIRLHPESYQIGQQTVGATQRIDPLFANNALEFYSTARGGHKLQRLLVRRLADTGVTAAVMHAGPGTNHHPRLGHGLQDPLLPWPPRRPPKPARGLWRRVLLLLCVSVACAVGIYGYIAGWYHVRAVPHPNGVQCAWDCSKWLSTALGCM